MHLHNYCDQEIMLTQTHSLAGLVLQASGVLISVACRSVEGASPAEKGLGSTRGIVTPEGGGVGRWSRFDLTIN